MSKVIQVLAKMASEASLQNSQDVEALLASTSIDSEQSEAIIAKDVSSLERQLDICPDFVCALVPAEDEEPTESEENDTDKTEEVKSVSNF